MRELGEVEGETDAQEAAQGVSEGLQFGARVGAQNVEATHDGKAIRVAGDGLEARLILLADP